MHSSRMHTCLLFTVQGGLFPGGLSRGGLYKGVSVIIERTWDQRQTPLEGSNIIQRHPPWTE